MVEKNITNAAWIETHPSYLDTNFNNTTLWVDAYHNYSTPTYFEKTYITLPFDILGKTNIQLHVYVLSMYGGTTTFKIYNTDNFDETTLTGNNAPATGSLIGTFTVSSTGWNVFDLTSITAQNIVMWNLVDGSNFSMSSDEGGNIPYFSYDLPPVPITITPKMISKGASVSGGISAGKGKRRR